MRIDIYFLERYTNNTLSPYKELIDEPRVCPELNQFVIVILSIIGFASALQGELLKYEIKHLFYIILADLLELIIISNNIIKILQILSH